MLITFNFFSLGMTEITRRIDCIFFIFCFLSPNNYLKLLDLFLDNDLQKWIQNQSYFAFNDYEVNFCMKITYDHIEQKRDL